MDPYVKELNPHRKASKSPATKPSGRGGNPNPILTEVDGELLAIDMNAKVSHKPCEKGKAQSCSSLNPNVSEVPAVSQTGETSTMDVGEKPSSDDSMKVFLRIRPLVLSPHKSKSLKQSSDKFAWPKLKAGRGENVKLEKKKTSCIQVCGCHSVTIVPPSTLNRMKSEVYRGFSQVFAAESTQEEVYAKTVSPIVEDFLRGKSGLLAASGPSGSGKTHTMFGTAREPGLVPRALRHIYHPSLGSQDGPKRSFYLSIFEIYVDNGKTEKLSDLSPDGGEVQLQQSGLKGLKELHIPDYMQAEAMIARALLRRNIGMTNSNSQSSRSQCIICIRCVMDNINGKVETQVNESVLTFVDLAGAEREKKTGNQGTRLLESTFINKTSMVFGLCLKSLQEHQKNPKKPLRKHFQSSLLTRYLRDYLEGKKRMALILTVRPAEEDYLDTSFLLRQASPYMEIKFLNKDETSQSKRRYETMFNVVSEQSKRIKTRCRTDSMDKVTISAHASDTIEAKPRKVPVSKLNGEITFKTFNADSGNERDYKILSGFAKSIWSLLKEHNLKIKVLEKRNMELQKEINDLKSSSCACKKEASVEVASLVADTYFEITSPSKELVGHRSAASDSGGDIDESKGNEKQVDICNNGCDNLEVQRSTDLKYTEVMETGFKSYSSERDSNLKYTEVMETGFKSYSSEPVQMPEDHLSSFHEAIQNKMVGEEEDDLSTNTKESEKKAHMCKTESEHPQEDFEGGMDVFKVIEQADIGKTGCDCAEEKISTYLGCKGDSEAVQLPEEPLSAFHEAKLDALVREVEDCQTTNMNESDKKAHICKSEAKHPVDDSEGEIDVSKEIEKKAGTCKTGFDFQREQTPTYLKQKGNMELASKSYSSIPIQFLEDHLSSFHVAKQIEAVEVEDCQPTNVMELEKKSCICKTEPEHTQDDCCRSQNFQGNVNNERRNLEKEDNKETSFDSILKGSNEKMPDSSFDLSSTITSKSDGQSTRKNGKQKYINCDGGGNLNYASEPGKSLIPHEKSSVKAKPKRRLMPASSVLLRHVNNLDFKDEEGPGSRRGKSSVDENRRATNSASLLRLLKVNAHH